MPTYALSCFIEHFFHYPSERTLADVKRICNQNHPLEILIKFKFQLNRNDSTYYKHLRLFDFKSQYANLLMEKFEAIVAQLIMAHGICRSFSTNSIEKVTLNVEQIASSIIRMIREQRKEVPNMLTPKMILRHLSGIDKPECFEEEALPWEKKYNTKVLCPGTAAVSFSLLLYVVRHVIL